jgi:uncharacterized OsmC-like protein
MKIILLGEDAVRLEPDGGPMTIEALSADQQYSPFHMLASSLAYCTFSILHSWAETVKLGADDLAIEVRWTFAEEPHRVGAMTVSLEWPSLPAARTAVAQRVATLCPIHATLHQTPTVTIARTGEAAAASAVPETAAAGAPAR